jgi:hypothetical protein
MKSRQTIGLKILALCAGFMIYYGFYSKLKRVVQKDKSVEESNERDTIIWQSDTVQW